MSDVEFGTYYRLTSSSKSSCRQRASSSSCGRGRRMPANELLPVEGPAMGSKTLDCEDDGELLTDTVSITQTERSATYILRCHVNAVEHLFEPVLGFIPRTRSGSGVRTLRVADIGRYGGVGTLWKCYSHVLRANRMYTYQEIIYPRRRCYYWFSGRSCFFDAPEEIGRRSGLLRVVNEIAIRVGALYDVISYFKICKIRGIQVTHRAYPLSCVSFLEGDMLCEGIQALTAWTRQFSLYVLFVIKRKTLVCAFLRKSPDARMVLGSSVSGGIEGWIRRATARTSRGGLGTLAGPRRATTPRPGEARARRRGSRRTSSPRWLARGTSHCCSERIGRAT